MKEITHYQLGIMSLDVITFMTVDAVYTISICNCLACKKLNVFIHTMQQCWLTKTARSGAVYLFSDDCVIAH